MEPEDFTSRLYQELNSSPQPYLVPFLKVRLVTHLQTKPKLLHCSVTLGLTFEHCITHKLKSHQDSCL